MLVHAGHRSLPEEECSLSMASAERIVLEVSWRCHMHIETVEYPWYARFVLMLAAPKSKFPVRTVCGRRNDSNIGR